MSKHDLSIAILPGVLMLACNRGPIDTTCDLSTPLVYAAMISPPAFPAQDQVQFWVGADRDGDELIELDETTLFWERSDPRTPLGLAATADGERLYVLYDSELHVLTDSDNSGVGDEHIEVPLEDTGLAGPVLQNGRALFLTAGAQVSLREFWPSTGQTTTRWIDDNRIGSDELALATAGAPDQFWISEADAETIWLLDVDSGELEAVVSGPADLLPVRSLSYRGDGGLVWISPAGQIYRLANPGEGEPRALVENPGCMTPLDSGVGQYGMLILWGDLCGAEVRLGIPEGEITVLARPADSIEGFPIALAGAPDPCQDATTP